MNSTTLPLIELRNVAMCYGTREVFRSISLEVRRGECFALLGPSGCGKSTVLKLIAGLEPPSEGEILLDSLPASSAGRTMLAPHRRSLALVFQDLALWPNLSVGKNVELGLSGLRLPRHERRKRAAAALAMCRIGELSARRPEQLSGGERQRVALARALAVRPKILLLDEPFASLDIAAKSRLYDEIRRLCVELALTLILVSHDPLEATALCERAAVLEEGRIVETGALPDLLAAPASETLRSFVGALSRSARSRGSGPSHAYAVETQTKQELS
jgi:ABC-type Fe3+/spermidine/putrescine transport system ATPase subunit